MSQNTFDVSQHVDPDLYGHMVSLGHNELTVVVLNLIENMKMYRKPRIHSSCIVITSTMVADVLAMQGARTLAAKLYWPSHTVIFQLTTVCTRTGRSVIYTVIEPYCGPEYSRENRSIPWLLMLWLLALPGHLQLWCWLCKMGRLLNSIRFSTLCHFHDFSVEEAYEIQMALAAVLHSSLVHHTIICWCTVSV